MNEPTEADIMKLRNAIADAIIPTFGVRVNFALILRSEEGGHCLSNTETDEELFNLVIPILVGISGREPDLSITIREPSNG